MRKTNKFTMRTLSVFMMVVALLIGFTAINKVVGQTYTNESFNASIPGYPIWTAGASFKTPTVDWTQAKISGGGVAPNDFEWTTGGTCYPPVAVTNQIIVGIPSGAGFIRYLNRNNGGGVCGSASPGAPNGDAAFIASRSLDWSGRLAHIPAQDTIGISVWRDNTAAALAVADYIEVWVNTQPSLSGAALALTTGGNNRIHRSTNLTPVAAGGWNRYTFVIPNDPRFYDPTNGGTSSAYIIIAGYSAGGNNIFIDNINMPQWQTPMVVTAANVFITQSADVGKNSTDNLMLGVQVTTKGSLTPKKLDGILFNTQGSTAFTTDVTQPNGAKCWYTGGSTTFATTLGAISVPKVNPTSPSYTNAQLYYGFLDGVAGCPTGLTTPAFNFFPGNENFVWLAYDIPTTAQAANFVAGGFEQLFTSWSTAGCFSDTVITSTGIQTPANFAAFVPSPSVSAIRQIDQAYNIPTYSQGTSWPGGGYYNNDFVSGVYFPGDGGTQIDNYLHDDTCVSCISVGGQNCARFSCHPPDYTQFKPINMGAYRERVVKVTQGKGVRTGKPPYAVKAQCGTWFSSNTVAIFIDWNKDGDFDDRYSGVGGFIYENYGSQQQVQSSMPLPAVWGANTSWPISVPSPTDVVTDLNDPGQLPNNSIGPIIVGNVRMRVREIFAAANNFPFVAPASGFAPSGVHPTNSGFTWGEVEDYTIQVLPDCPVAGSNVCKWVGATNSWKDTANWCPAIPTKNDIAYIAPGPLFSPTILDSTNAECRTLQIEPGAKVLIDATKGSSLKVYDDVIIGRGATLSTGSSLAVTSDFIKTITIPGKSQVPPLGLALVTVTPFRTNAQAKTQIAYTATELKTTYGWKAGDVIDQISIEVNSISGGAGPSTYSGLRIMAYLRTAAVTFPFPPPANTKIACMPGDAQNVAGWPKVIFGPGSTTLNMPMGTLGTQAGGNYYTFNLIPNTLIWDGVSNLVLSFENWTALGLAPAKSYVLYDESNASFNVCAINAPTVTPGAVNGQNICGPNTYYNPGLIVGGGATAVVSNQRPRLDFKLNRPYKQFPITVGGDWINNNTEQRTTVYSTTPTYGFVGDSGFIASNSRVIFDPTGRSGVNSPGLTVANISYYTGTPGATLVADIDQLITSELTVTANRTMFGVLEVNKSAATGKAVKQSSVVANLIGANTDTLVLTNGELNLNKKEFTLRKSTASSLIRTNGWMKSEDVNGILDSKFTWKMGTDVGVHVIPWGDGIRYFPFTYTSVAGDQGDVKFATYHTAITNTTLPASPILITKFNDYSIGGVLQTVPNAYDWTVDRYWYVNRLGSTGTASLKFGYDDLYEGTNTASYVAAQMKATRSKNDTMWWDQQPGQSDVKIGNSVTVTTSNLLKDSINGIWVVSRTNFTGQGPLPISLIDFTAKVIDKKVKLGWTVQSERDVTLYNIERTVDNNNFEFIALREPIGPSTSLLNYEAWDNYPKDGLQYYRLATNFSDGTIDYSKLVPIRIGTDGTFAINSIIAVDGQIKTNFTYDSQLPYNYMVVDITGRTVVTGENQKAIIGTNEIIFPVNLSKGVYTLMIQNAEKLISKKLIY